MDGNLFEKHLTAAEIEAGMPRVLASPPDNGHIEMIVRRPTVEIREVLESGELDIATSLVGDNWLSRGSSRTNTGLGHPECR